MKKNKLTIEDIEKAKKLLDRLKINPIAGYIIFPTLKGVIKLKNKRKPCK